MTESEHTVRRRATSGAPGTRRICKQLVEAPDRYALWYSLHERRMRTVAMRNQREVQILALRAVYVEQIHRAALVRYLRKHALSSAAREMTLQEFYGVTDPTRATIAEHKSYLIAASSQLCAYHVLKLVGDDRGISLIQDYQGSYGQYFGMFCENMRALKVGSSYILQSLIPDAKDTAEALRARILGGEGIPSAPLAIRSIKVAKVARV